VATIAHRIPNIWDTEIPATHRVKAHILQAIEASTASLWTVKS